MRALSPLAPLSGLRVERESTVGLSRDSTPPLPAWWPVPLPAASRQPACSVSPVAPTPPSSTPHATRALPLLTRPTPERTTPPQALLRGLHTPLRALSNRNRANHGRVRIRDARDTIEVSGIPTGLTRPDVADRPTWKTADYFHGESMELAPSAAVVD